MGKSLLEVLRTVALDADEQSAFQADPGGYLGQYGYEDVPVNDLSEAVGLMADTLPPEAAEAVGPTGTLGQAAEGGTSWVDALQRLDDSPGAPTPPGEAASESTTAFGDVDFDSGLDARAADTDDSSLELEGNGGEGGATLDVWSGDPADEVDFGAGSAVPASEETPPSPEAESSDASPEADLDFGGLSQPMSLDDPLADQAHEEAAFNSADDFADQLQHDQPDEVEELDIGSF